MKINKMKTVSTKSLNSSDEEEDEDEEKQMDLIRKNHREVFEKQKMVKNGPMKYSGAISPIPKETMDEQKKKYKLSRPKVHISHDIKIGELICVLETINWIAY